MECVVTPTERLAELDDDDRRNLREVVDSQVAKGNRMTLVPTDVLVRLLTTPAPLDVERLVRAELHVHSWDEYTARAEARAIAAAYAAEGEG
jgi:hypothetical protein